MWSLVMYSNYFKIASTVTFLNSQPDLFQVYFCLKLSLYTINNDYTRYNICMQCLVFRYQLVYWSYMA